MRFRTFFCKIEMIFQSKINIQIESRNQQILISLQKSSRINTLQQSQTHYCNTSTTSVWWIQTDGRGSPPSMPQHKPTTDGPAAFLFQSKNNFSGCIYKLNQFRRWKMQQAHQKRSQRACVCVWDCAFRSEKQIPSRTIIRGPHRGKEKRTKSELTFSPSTRPLNFQ